jgi:Glycosyltransferase like family 2
MPVADVPEEVRRLVADRAERREARDFAAADELRARIEALGFEVVDGPAGTRVVPATEPPAVRRVPPGEVGSVLDRPPSADVTFLWLTGGWPEDVARGIASFEQQRGGTDIQHVVVDADHGEPGRWPEGVELVALDRDPGYGACRNVALRRADGEVVVVADGSVEAGGDALSPLRDALDDRSVGVAGPYGLVTEDLRTFREFEGPEVDAVEGYLMAFRRDVLTGLDGFDEAFRFYRMADVELSFRVRDSGLRAVVVPAPVTRHEHRAWAALPPDERDRRSKRNFSRFLDRFRGRTDLLVRGGGET